MWVLIDNYDSFTYILRDYLLQIQDECVVYRNDEITVEELKTINPSRIIISPGPETPAQAGICMDVIDAFHRSTPILGICLGHQALGMYFGAKLKHAPYPMHGKTSPVSFEEHPIFHGLTSPFTAMRYHSLVIDELPVALESIAVSDDDHCIMAMQHREYDCLGIQFHPESIGTEVGLTLLKNWKEMYK